MKTILLISLFAIGSISLANAQRRLPTAKNAVDVLARAKGGEILGKIVQIYGSRGQDQPEVWVIISHDPRRPALLWEHQVQRGRVISEKLIKEAYTLKLKGPNMPVADINLDSDRLFGLVDKEAKAVRLGFDSIDYELRCRELSTEPIWVVNLRDRESRSVGVIFVSAKTSTVVRRLWNQRPAAPMVAERDSRPANVQNSRTANQVRPPQVPPTNYRAKKPNLIERIKQKLSGGR